MMNPEDIRWEYLSDFDWMIFVGCLIAVTALTICLAIVRANNQTIVKLVNALDDLREEDAKYTPSSHRWRALETTKEDKDK